MAGHKRGNVSRGLIGRAAAIRRATICLSTRAAICLATRAASTVVGGLLAGLVSHEGRSTNGATVCVSVNKNANGTSKEL